MVMWRSYPELPRDIVDWRCSRRGRSFFLNYQCDFFIGDFSYSLVPWSGIACMYSGFMSLVFETFLVVRSKDRFNGRLYTFAQRIMHKYEHAKNLTSFVVFCNKYKFFIKQ